MGTTAEKLSYLNTTKTNIKEALNLSGANITDDTFRSYADKIKKSYLEVMNNGWQPIWNNWTKVNGTGTTLSLNNTEEAPMSLTYKGNTLQNGTPTPSSPVPIQVVSGDNSIEVCGKNLFDKSQELVNTIINSVGGAGTDNSYCASDYLSFTPNTTITLSTDSASTLIIAEYNGSKTFIKRNIKANATNYAITTDSNTKYIRVCYFKTVSKVQLEKGSATTYEPYQGASYPISLGVENLLNTKNYGSGSNGIGITSNEENVLQVSGTASANTNVLIEFNDITLQAGTYYFYLLRNSTTRVDIGLRTTGNATISSANFGNLFQNTLNNKSFTLDSSTVIHSINFYYPSGTVATDTYKIMICRETHTEEEFTPYGKAIQLLHIPNTNYYDKIDKSTGKNLFDKDSVVLGKVWNGTSNTKRAYGYIEAIQGQTYTISNSNTNSDLSIYAVETTVIGQSVNPVKQTQLTSSKLTFTPQSTTKYIVIQYSTTTNNTTQEMVDKSFVQIELGDITTPVYEPYGTNWYLKKEIGKVVLDGTQTYNNDLSNPSQGRYDFIIDNALLRGLCVSSHFKYAFAIENGKIFISGSVANDISIINTAITTKEAMLTWLSTNKPIAYYQLSTPTYTLIEDSTLINQLEEAKKSYESQTNISQTNNDLPFELDVVTLSNQ